jgi:hypothetical protein
VTLALYALLACTTDDTKDTATDTGADTATDTADTGEASPPLAVVVTSDYTVGTLNTADMDGALTPDLLPTSGDTVVFAEGDRLWLLDRSANVIRAYDGRDFTAPAWEASTGEGSNPVGVATCGGKVFVARYFVPSLLVLDPATGLSLGEVDLSAFADDDGSPEADSLIAAPNGRLYATLNQLDYLVTYASVDGSGTLVEVDCEALTVRDSWDVGPNPHATAIGDGATLAIHGGDYFLPDWSGPALDGGLWRFDTETGTLSEPLLTEESLGGNIGNVVIREDGRGLYTLDDGYTWSVSCFDATTGAAAATFDPAAFVQGAVLAPDGTAWLVQRSPFSGEAGTVGTVRVSLETCDPAAPIATTLEPYSVAILR